MCVIYHDKFNLKRHVVLEFAPDFAACHKRIRWVGKWKKLSTLKIWILKEAFTLLLLSLGLSLTSSLALWEIRFFDNADVIRL